MQSNFNIVKQSYFVRYLQKNPDFGGQLESLDSSVDSFSQGISAKSFNEYFEKVFKDHAT